MDNMNCHKCGNPLYKDGINGKYEVWICREKKCSERRQARLKPLDDPAYTGPYLHKQKLAEVNT